MDRKIRVGMDISQLAHKGGVATYTKNLAERLSGRSDLEMVYFYSSLRKPYQGKLENVKKYKLPPTLFEILFNRWRNVSIEKFLGALDIFHSSDWTQPPAKAKKVTTVHDLVPIKFPQWSHPKIVSVFKRKLKLVEQETDHVIVVSQTTKDDLLEISKIPEEKITVIYEGPTADFKKQPEEKIMKFRKKYNLPDKFILAIGGIGERRNLKRIKEACKGYNLVIAGQTLPWLSIDELELLYNCAEALVYCSLYEGFGIPILDAFACGLPVITSNISAMPEVGGKAAIYVDPYNQKDIKEKIDLLMNDKKVQTELSNMGLNRVKEFSWEKAVDQTARVYKELIK